MKVSFIIPAYNEKERIKRGLDSLINQKHTSLEYEIIVIDDGSTDNLIEVIAKYPSVKYITKENGGLSSARNYGTKYANGEYIIFMDADDYVEEDLLSNIESYIFQGYDLIKWNLRMVDEKGQELERFEPVKEFRGTGEECFNKLYGADPMLTVVCNYAIKKELVPQFPLNAYHEDFATTPLMILKAKRMIITELVEYNYVQTENSIVRNNDVKKQLKRIKDIFKHYDNLISETEKMKLEETTKENMRIFCTNAALQLRKELYEENKEFYLAELKERNVYKNIQPRNLKQFLKRIYLKYKYN